MNNVPADKNRRVLVIDDNRAIHDDFRKILSPATATAAALDATEAALFGDATETVQQTQFEVCSAYQGQEGLTLVEQALAAGLPYAMAFVDVRMPPGWDGVETTRRIWEVDPHLQVVLCTAYSDYSWDEMFEKLGHSDGLLILKKPFDAVEAFQLAHALTEKWWLHQESRRKMEELESRVAERTQEWRQTNHALQTEVADHTRAEEELRRKTAFLEAQVNSSIDGILVVDREGKKALQNQRVADLFEIPPAIADANDDAAQVRWVTNTTKNPEQFVEKVLHLYAHPYEISRDEIELKDGTTLDRYSAPVVGKEGNHYGRIWTFRDITERKQAEISALVFSKLGKNLSSAGSPEEAAGIISEASDDLLGWDASCVQLYSEKDDLIHSIFNADTIDGKRTISNPIEARKPTEMNRRILVSGAKLILRDRPASVLADAVGFGDISRPSASLMFVPIRYGTRVVGILSIQSYSPKAYDEQDLTTLQTLADHCGGALERIWAGEALQRSQERLRDLIDGLGPSMFVGLMTPEGIMIECNRPALAAAGLKPEEVLGKPFEETYWWAYSKGVQQQLRDTIARAARGEPSRFDAQIRVAENQLIDVDFSLQPLRDETGEVVFLVPSACVITERKQAENALLESERRFSDMLRNLELVSMMLDREARITYCNDHLLRLTGWQREEVMGRDWFGLFLPPERFSEMRRVHAALLDDQPAAWHYENEIVIRSGGRRLIRWNNSVLRSASGKVTGTASIGEDITERKQADAALQGSEARTKAIVQSSLDCIVTMDHEGKILEFNPAAEKVFGYARADVLGKELAQLLIPPSLRERHRQGMLHYLATGETQVIGNRIEMAAMRSDGSEFPIELAITRMGAATPATFAGFIRDISERKLLEDQLFQSQKMETVGRLAGGVAHEFNSIMTAIIGQSELLLNDLPPGDPLSKNATEIRQAADRAATLTRQLLAYGRKQMLQPAILDLNSVLAGMETSLRHLAGEGGDVRIVLAPGLKAVKADAGQIEQVIMNLAMNAADAMPSGGKLTLETANVTLDQQYVSRFPELKAGEYVMLAVTDTGAGMSEEVRASIFEPFFTTKGVGQGTGLGLSTCYGIIKQSGGHISAYSELGRGATFKIYLPQVEVQAKAPAQHLDSPDLPRGMETILLVEDDPALREMAAMLLKRLGYAVLAAANGIEALALIRQHGIGHIDLLFTDVVMPHMSGKELADRVRALHPHTRILFTSAYTGNAMVHQGVLNAGVALLQKPFTPSALARKLRAVLDEPAGGTPAATI